MFEKPNLLITYDTRARTTSEAEAKRLLDHAGARKAKFLRSHVDGLFAVHVDGDPKELVRRLGALCAEHPSWFARTFRWVPVESWVRSDPRHLEATVARAARGIGPDDSWKLTVSKRHYATRSTDLIEDLARFVPNPKVDLENPDKVVRVEIVEKRAGVSLLGPGDWLNVTEAKENAAEAPTM